MPEILVRCSLQAASATSPTNEPGDQKQLAANQRRKNIDAALLKFDLSGEYSGWTGWTDHFKLHGVQRTTKNFNLLNYTHWQFLLMASEEEKCTSPKWFLDLHTGEHFDNLGGVLETLQLQSRIYSFQHDCVLDLSDRSYFFY